LGERAFVQSLMMIAARLVTVSDREQRAHRLMAELALLNLNVPARVWLPLYSHERTIGVHHVLRVPPQVRARA
jgi:phosphatidylinositol 4-kinase